jgi:hypothetical protein
MRTVSSALACATATSCGCAASAKNSLPPRLSDSLSRDGPADQASCPPAVVRSRNEAIGAGGGESPAGTGGGLV